MGKIVDRVSEVYQKIKALGDNGVWISLVPEAQSLELAAALEKSDAKDLPLLGKIFGIKDSIDLAGIPTTCACPEFAYTPQQNAFVVSKLLDAGAIPIGKTNLDQFATGLNGTRTPFTIPRNAYNPDYISGGSSSGSAIAVALGLVDFALATDTAGSGRVPAGFNNLVGLKPTVGRWSSTGLFPACRTLDGITVLTKTVADAMQIDRVVRGFDPANPFSREGSGPFFGETRRVGILKPEHREFFGDTEYAALYQKALTKAAELGWKLEEFDYEPLLQAAALLYNGPWVAERHAVMREFFEANPEVINPVVRGIIDSAKKFTATDAFNGVYRLKELARYAQGLWSKFDALLLPSSGTIYTVEQMLANPVELNTKLGRYTNFVNLLDMCGLAIPAGFREDGLPFGVTLIGPAWSDDVLAGLGAEFVGEPAIPPGEKGIQIAVVGAHLRGQPLNHQLVNLGARFVKSSRTAPCYRLFALPTTTPPKPGMIRAASGASIALEVWELSAAGFGKLVGAIPPPLCIGSVELETGEWVKGFLCEELALAGAAEITEFGGWLSYLSSQI